MKIGHHSSRYDSSADKFKQAAELVAEHCSIATFTEVAQNPNVTKGRDRFHKLGWGTWQPDAGNPTGSDENALVWDKSKWELEHKAKAKLSEIRYTREGGALAPFTVGLAGLFRRLGTDERWLLATLHLPANTTDGQGSNVHWNGAGNSTRGDQFRDVMRNLGPWLKNLREQWERGGATTLIGADWNQRCEDAWFRDHVRDWMPDEYAVSTGPYPNTIGDSTYDYWIEGKNAAPNGDAHALTTPASDHKFVWRAYERP